MVETADRIVGIDLGTTYSAIAYVDPQGHPVNIPNQHGEFITPSVVQILPDRKILVGREAALGAADRPERTAFNVKRDMGEEFYREPLGGKKFSPEALSALILKQLVLDARRHFGDVREAVITVPAYFGDARRKATEDAGRIAGLKVADVLNEPTAAALANAFREYLERGGKAGRFDLAEVADAIPTTTLVFDLGGGTFDVTVIRIDGNNFDVLATGGEVRLGGVDFDERLLSYYADEFARRYGADPRDDPGTALRIRNTCELAKRALSIRTETVVVAEHFSRRLSMPLTRGMFNELTADLLSRMQLSTEMVLEDAMLTWDRIDAIFLVGGATRMPCVQEMLARISGKQPTMSEAPDQIVSHGAAIHAAILQMQREAAATPTKGAGAAGEEPSREGAAAGQAFDAAVVDAARKVKLENVNAHGLGVVVRSSRENRVVHSRLIPRNTPLPSTRTKVFGTEVADQTTVRLRIVEGESRDPGACTQIGECVIHNLPPGLPQGSPVEVTFRYDQSGRLHVKAVELTHQLVAEVQIERESGFDKDEIQALADKVDELMNEDL
jgi:molecular chaperone DnaK